MPQSRYVETKLELAQRLGVKYGTLLAWFKQHDRPQNFGQGERRYEVEAWEEWRRNRSIRKVMPNGIPAYEPNAREKSIIAKNTIAAAQAQFDLDVKMGKYVLRTQANRDIDTANAIVMRELEKMMKHTLPPKIDGITPGQFAKLGMAELNKALKFLPGHFQAAANDEEGS